jgi:hypothetical protein
MRLLKLQDAVIIEVNEKLMGRSVMANQCYVENVILFKYDRWTWAGYQFNGGSPT